MVLTPMVSSVEITFARNEIDRRVNFNVIEFFSHLEFPNKIKDFLPILLFFIISFIINLISYPFAALIDYILNHPEEFKDNPIDTIFGIISVSLYFYIFILLMSLLGPGAGFYGIFNLYIYPALIIFLMLLLSGSVTPFIFILSIIVNYNTWFNWID
jgi:hypothetical protein